MRILFISDILLTGDFPLRLYQEGHDVRLYIADKRCKSYLDKLVPKTNSWKRDLKWVGKDGLIIFDDVDSGRIQDSLRKKGYTVFGGSELAERTEKDRFYGQEIFKKAGLKTVPLQSFWSAVDAVEYIKRNPNCWVIKYSNGHYLKPYAYLGEEEDGSDSQAVLENYARYKINRKELITLQERVQGIEIGVARYFNGSDWVGPIEYNVEHTDLFPNDQGPVVDEMGTLAWYDDDETEKLYRDVLKPLKPFLKRADFRGDFDINCIVNEKGAFPIEATARLGSPIIHIQEEFHESPWGDFLHAVASGKDYDLKWKRGFGVAVSVVIPPFPYPNTQSGRAILGTPVKLDPTLIRSGLEHVHFDEIASRNGSFGQIYVTGTWGTPLYVTGFGESVTVARRQAYNTLRRLYIPRMFYRSDIGRKFVTRDFRILKEWGYLKRL